MIHRYTMHWVAMLYVFLTIVLPSPTLAVETTTLTVDTIPFSEENRNGSETSYATVPVEALQTVRWQQIILPDVWQGPEYYLTIEDTYGRPIPGYDTIVPDQLSSIDITEIDATLYPSIKAVMWSESAASVPISGSLSLTYTADTNYRLIGFATAMALLYGIILLLSAWFKITPVVILRTTTALLRGPTQSISLRQATVFAASTILWAAVYAVALGSSAGGIQYFYLLIKLPFLFLGTMACSLGSLVVLTLLSGIRVSGRQLAIHAVELMACTTVALASLSPVMLFLIIVSASYQTVLQTFVLSVTAAGVLTAWRLHSWLRLHQIRFTLPIIALWFILYGLVFLQLGWELRPWVGVLDPLTGSLPFARTTRENVYEAIFKLFL